MKNRKELLELAVQLFDIISSFDLSETNGDNDYLMTNIYHKLQKALEEENTINLNMARIKK